MSYRKVKINVGDRVGYRVAWLRNTGQAHTAVAHMRGIVVGLAPFHGDKQVAEVRWDGEEGTSKVLDQNLAVVGSLAFTSEDG